MYDPPHMDIDISKIVAREVKKEHKNSKNGRKSAMSSIYKIVKSKCISPQFKLDINDSNQVGNC